MKRFGIGCLGLIVFGFLFLWWMLFSDRSSFQTGIASHEGLPQTASDITVFKNPNITGTFVADFKITEQDFATFAATQEWPLKPITDPVDVFQAKAVHEGRPHDQKKIVDGLFYSELESNNGGGTVAYDRKDGRGYIDLSSR